VYVGQVPLFIAPFGGLHDWLKVSTVVFTSRFGPDQNVYTCIHFCTLAHETMFIHAYPDISALQSLIGICLICLSMMENLSGRHAHAADSRADSPGTIPCNTSSVTNTRCKKDNFLTALHHIKMTFCKERYMKNNRMHGGSVRIMQASHKCKIMEEQCRLYLTEHS